jgi:cytochrome P450
MLRNAPTYMLGLADRYGGIVALSPRRVHLVTHPDHVKHVLQDNHLNYVKGPRYLEQLKPLMGISLFTTDGETWRRQRRLVQPAFQRKQNVVMFDVMVATINEMLCRWERNANNGQPVDVRRELIELTLGILLRTMFSSDLHGHEDELRDAFLEVQKSMNLVDALNPLKIPRWLPTSVNRSFSRAVRTLDSFVFRIIEERRRQGNDATGDVVSMLISARDEQTGKGLTDQELRDALVTILQAGNDTVSDAVTWTWYLLAKHPGVQERLEREVDSVLDRRGPAYEDLTSLVYTNTVVMESMRMYPPAWVFGRTLLADDVIDGYTLPANSLIVISPYVTHRLPEFWDKPDVFAPDRFTPEQSQQRPRFAYLPFGGGPRLCVGSGMAMQEAQLIVSMVAQKFRLRLASDFSMELKPRISLSQDRIMWATPERSPHS